jgi:hypothetical protein
VRPVKEPGPNSGNIDLRGSSRGEPGVRRIKQRGPMLPAAPVTRPEKEPDAMWTVADRRCIAAAILILKRGRKQDRQDDPGPPPMQKISAPR